MADEIVETPTPALGDAPNVETPTPVDTGIATTPDDWRTRIPAELKTATDWSKFKTEADVFKSYAELEKYRGDSVRIPKADAPDEEWGKFYDKVRPASPEGYNVTFPDVGGVVNWPDEDKTWATKIAHAIGLSERQFQRFVQAHSERLAENAKTLDVQRRDGLKVLADEYGATFQRDVALANRALDWAGGNDFLEFVKASGLGAEPVFVRAMLKIGKRFADDGVVLGEVAGIMSKDEALTRISEMRGDAKHPLNNDRHPGHKDAVAELTRLYSLAYN
jgi:hypothetical protein